MDDEIQHQYINFVAKIMMSPVMFQNWYSTWTWEVSACHGNMFGYTPKKDHMHSSVQKSPVYRF